MADRMRNQSPRQRCLSSGLEPHTTDKNLVALPSYLLKRRMEGMVHVEMKQEHSLSTEAKKRILVGCYCPNMVRLC